MILTMVGVRTEVVATTTEGRVRGFWRQDSAAFLGVPFAAPPTGARRFLAPERPAAWSGVVDASTFGPTPQRRVFGPVTTIPEPVIPGDQTLNVNVFTPSPGDRDAMLPVMVWIHGGGFFAGSPASPWYDGRSFNRDGVVTVTLSYRLGFDGFGWIDGAPLNRGLLDQIAGLRWVQENIREFGGDPSRVTIAGQSAGGRSALALMAAPAADGLFASVVAESGIVGSLREVDAADIGRGFARSMGIGSDLESWRGLTESAILDREREFNVLPSAIGVDSTPAAMIAGLREPTQEFAGLAFVPVIDGVGLLDLDERIRSGAHSTTPVLVGATANEFPIPGDDELGVVTDALRLGGVSPEGTAAFSAEVRAVGATFARSQLFSTGMFRLPVVRFAATRVESGAGDRTWLYDFRFRSPVTGVAAHCSELPFVWDLLDADGVTDVLGPRPPVALATAMHAAWVRFIGRGDADWPSAQHARAGAERFDETTRYDSHAYALEAEFLDG